MSRLLVHLHLFYLDQVDYFIEKLGNINGCDWELYVTLSRNDKQTEQKIKTAFPSAKIISAENRGYDIWPFIWVIKNVDLSHYDYVLKLHSKSFYDKAVRVNKYWYKGYEWRNILTDSLLKSKEHFAGLLRTLERQPKTGMLCSRLFYMPLSDFLPEDTSALRRETERAGIAIKTQKFLTGSMFIARSAVFKKLQDDKICAELFPLDPSSHSFGTMAHIYERILSLLVYDAGLKIGTISSDKGKEIRLDIKECVEPIAERIFALRRKGERQIKTLTLLGIDIPLEKTSSKKPCV